MSVLQDATLNLAKLLKHDPELGAEVSGEGRFMPSEALLEDDGIRLAEPLTWTLTVSAAGGDEFILVGGVSGIIVQECRRCLTDVQIPLESTLLYPMRYQPSRSAESLKLLENDDEDDVLVFSKPEVDFAPLLVQVFAIESPLTVLCREDCKGLSLDGVNLNEHPGHQATHEPQSAPPSPFESLKDIEL